MNSNQRARSEKVFGTWIEKEDGGRIYSFEIARKLGWRAKYLKEVNNKKWLYDFGRRFMMRISAETYMKSTQLIKDIKSFKNDYKIIIAEKLLAYLQHRLSIEKLVDWVEQSLMKDAYEDDQLHTIRNVLAQLGLADVKALAVA